MKGKCLICHKEDHKARRCPLASHDGDEEQNHQPQNVSTISSIPQYDGPSAHSSSSLIEIPGPGSPGHSSAPSEASAGDACDPDYQQYEEEQRGEDDACDEENANYECSFDYETHDKEVELMKSWME